MALEVIKPHLAAPSTRGVTDRRVINSILCVPRNRLLLKRLLA
jgi:hypothetical protein